MTVLLLLLYLFFQNTSAMPALFPGDARWSIYGRFPTVKSNSIPCSNRNCFNFTGTGSTYCQSLLSVSFFLHSESDHFRYVFSDSFDVARPDSAVASANQATMPQRYAATTVPTSLTFPIAPLTSSPTPVRSGVQSQAPPPPGLRQLPGGTTPAATPAPLAIPAPRPFFASPAFPPFFHLMRPAMVCRFCKCVLWIIVHSRRLLPSRTHRRTPSRLLRPPLAPHLLYRRKLQLPYQLLHRRLRWLLHSLPRWGPRLPHPRPRRLPVSLLTRRAPHPRAHLRLSRLRLHSASHSGQLLQCTAATARSAGLRARPVQAELGQCRLR